MKKADNFLLTLVICSLLISCTYERNKPGYSYFPDMDENKSVGAYSTLRNTEYNSGMLMPADHSVPRELIPYPFSKSKEERLKAGLTYTFVDDQPCDTAVGKKLFTNYCVMCHGIQGDGMGFLIRSGLYPYKASSLLKSTVQDVPEGEIYHVITVGWALMGPHGSLLTTQERWDIVSYVKGL